jgi:NAD+ synthase (glutamine-hydrolysing)
VPTGSSLEERCYEVFSIQVFGLAKRLQHTGCRRAVLGISGGLDSTWALLVTVGAFEALKMPRGQIEAVTMPGFGTTGRTYANAQQLMQQLGVHIREVSIVKAVNQHFEDIGQDPDRHDVTYENAQARERTQILMDIANQVNGLVIGTGDLSELALGWTTFNGDHMSMYGVNAGVPKTLVRSLIEWYKNKESEQAVRAVLEDILATPVSPELLPVTAAGEMGQKTEELVGPYELHDFFLYYMLRFGFKPSKMAWMAIRAFEGTYERTTVLKWLTVFYRRFFSQQFKRSCLPDGPKIGSVSLSPRSDWRMPSDATVQLWLDDLKAMNKID